MANLPRIHGDQAVTAGAWPSRIETLGAVAPLPPGEWVAGVRDAGPTSTIEIRRLSTGERLATLSSGFSVMAVVRKTRGEILVSDVVADLPSGAGLPHPRLWVLDERTLVIKGGPIPLPERAMYTLYAPAMTLSGDERSLFYLRHRECGDGCDDYALAVLDLDSMSERAAASLPRGCGFAELTKVGEGGLIAMCPNLRSLWKVDRTGSAAEVASFNSLEWPIHGGVTASGQAFMVTQKGRLIVKDANGALIIDRTLAAPGGFFSGLDRIALPDGRDVLGVRPSPDGDLSAQLVLNRADWTTRVLELPLGVTHLVATGDSAVAAVGPRTVIVANTRDGAFQTRPVSGDGFVPSWSFGAGTN
ncbi:MAG: hypothetical protein M3T56_09375 [Chloroflexota bacterium]|nr:hypothetical protein [Chloroflexota bacterium]